MSLLAAGLALLAASPARAVTTDTLLVLTGATTGDWFGVSVATAGDVNGDGFADLIVGAYANDAAGPDAGRAFVYYGGPGADAVADLVFTGAAEADYFGTSVGSAGDVNGDGYADLIVGAPANDAGGDNAGSAYVYFGGPSADSAADLHLVGEAAGDFFGLSVGTAGDVNGDGYADVIVGAWYNDAGGEDAGRAYVFYGGPAPDAIADLVLTGEAASDNFGVSVGSAGDVNGDGDDDVIVGAWYNDTGGSNAGRAYVFYGGPSADTTADLRFTGEAAFDNLGASVASAGDVNGDGFADVIVGALFAGGAIVGHAYLYYGGPGADTIADLRLDGEAGYDNFGVSVGGAGDVNGDGYADVIVGAKFNDGGGRNAGRAYVYEGGPGVDAVADLTLTGAALLDDFGYSVGTAGDFDGDGDADLIVGAPLAGPEGSRSGQVYVLSLDRSTPTLLARFEAEPSDHGIRLRWQLADAAPRASVRLERADGPHGAWIEIAAERRVEGGVTEVLDGGVVPDATYYYRLGVSGQGGQWSWFGPLAATAGGSSGELAIAVVAPTPSRGTTRIEFTVARATRLRLTLVDVAGREVARLGDGWYRPGRHRATWSGERAPAGVYFVRLEAPERILVRRLVLCR